MKKNDIIYSFEITNGYVFRQIFELYDKLIINVIPIYFKENGFILRGGSGTNSKRKIVSDVEIFAEDIIDYYLNVDLATVPRTEDSGACFIEQINLNSLKTIFKSIAKSNSVKIYRTKDSNDIHIEVKGLTTEYSRISSSNYQTVNYDISEFDNLSEIPNLKIDIGQFCSSMKGMTRGDTEITNFKVFDKGLIIEGINNSGFIVKDGKWGNKEETSTETKVNSSIIKALCKISSIANYSIIKIFSKKNGYLKINHKVGDFGEHNIYLIDIQQDNE